MIWLRRPSTWRRWRRLESGDYQQATARADEFLKRHGSDTRAAATQYVAAESRLLANQPAEAARRYAELLKKLSRSRGSSHLAIATGFGSAPESSSRQSLGRASSR